MRSTILVIIASVLASSLAGRPRPKDIRSSMEKLPAIVEEGNHHGMTKSMEKSKRTLYVEKTEKAIRESTKKLEEKWFNEQLDKLTED
jgi:hypothetical protein